MPCHHASTFCRFAKQLVVPESNGTAQELACRNKKPLVPKCIVNRIGRVFQPSFPSSEKLFHVFAYHSAHKHTRSDSDLRFDGHIPHRAGRLRVTSRSSDCDLAAREPSHCCPTSARLILTNAPMRRVQRPELVQSTDHPA